VWGVEEFEEMVEEVVEYHDTHRAEDLSKQLCLGGVCTSKERREKERAGSSS